MSSQEGLSNLKEKLLNSDAVHSLKLETEVYDNFKKLKWETTHSPYFIDPKTEKDREIDIIATKRWNETTKHLTSDITFIVEAKNLKDYNIIGCNRLGSYAGCYPLSIWIGNNTTYLLPKLTEILTKHNIKSNDILSVRDQILKACYPYNEYLFLDYAPTSFNIPMFNSFRETNTAITRELENSVAWKALQGLKSCYEFYIKQFWQGIDYLINYAMKELHGSTKKLTEYLIDNLASKAKEIHYIHPLLVIESKLWQLENNDLKKLKYLRLVIQQMPHSPFWIDIVNKDHLNEYMLLTKYYDNFFEGMRLSPTFEERSVSMNPNFPMHEPNAYM